MYIHTQLLRRLAALTVLVYKAYGFSAELNLLLAAEQLSTHVIYLLGLRTSFSTKGWINWGINKTPQGDVHQCAPTPIPLYSSPILHIYASPPLKGLRSLAPYGSNPLAATFSPIYVNADVINVSVCDSF